MSVTVKIDTKTKNAKLFLEYIKTLPFVEVNEPEQRYNVETEKAIEEAKAKKGIIKTNSHQDLMKKLKQ